VTNFLTSCYSNAWQKYSIRKKTPPESGKQSLLFGLIASSVILLTSFFDSMSDLWQNNSNKGV